MTKTRTRTDAPKMWAAYVGMAQGQGITLHGSRLDALLSIADALELLTPDEDAGRVDVTEKDLGRRIEQHCLPTADDWYVQEVEIPLTTQDPVAPLPSTGVPPLGTGE